jgi:hypothetical protein
MKDLDVRRYEMLINVRDFCASYSKELAPGTRGGEVAAALNAATDQITQHMASEISGHAARREGTTTKAMARAALRDDLMAIARTARAMAVTLPNIAERFVVPGRVGDQVLLAVARSFAENAKPLEAEFLARHMAKDFLADLAQDIAALEQASRHQENGAQTHMVARRGIEDEMDAAFDALEELDAIVPNQFANDSEALTRWDAARRVDKSPRKAGAAAAAVATAGAAPGAEATPTS